MKVFRVGIAPQTTVLILLTRLEGLWSGKEVLCLSVIIFGMEELKFFTVLMVYGQGRMVLLVFLTMTLEPGINLLKTVLHVLLQATQPLRPTPTPVTPNAVQVP